MNKLNPVNDMVVLKKIESSKTTLSGIVIPGAGDEPNQGVVVAVGPGKKKEDGTREPLQVSVGSKVVYQEHVGQTVKVDGVELLIVKESDIIAVFE